MVGAFEDRARVLYGPSSLEKAKKRKLPPKKRPGIRGAPIRPIVIFILFMHEGYYYRPNRWGQFPNLQY